LTQNRHASSSALMCTTFFPSKGARLTVQFNLFKPAPCSTALLSTSWTAPLVHPVANPSLNASLLEVRLFSEPPAYWPPPLPHPPLVAQDLVVLHHEVVEETAQGGGRRHSATLLAFGESGSLRGGHPATAMATTVGLPVAIGAQVGRQRRGLLPMVKQVRSCFPGVGSLGPLPDSASCC
jgi:hypothetical protein